MLNYLLIESKQALETTKSMVIDMLKEFMEIKEINIIDQSLVIVFDAPVEISFNEIILNLSTETFVDYRLYEAYPFTDIELLYKHAHFMKQLISKIPFNQYVYLNDVLVIKYLLTKIDKTEYAFFLRTYASNEDMKQTIKVYLESNQNMSEAAKKLYIHRNTLIQRIDKFITVTGFDIKKFVEGYVIYYMLTH